MCVFLWGGTHAGESHMTITAQMSSSSSPSSSSWDRIFHWPGITKWTRLLASEPQGSPTSASQCWVYKRMPSHMTSSYVPFYMCAGDWRPLHLEGSTFQTDAFPHGLGRTFVPGLAAICSQQSFFEGRVLYSFLMFKFITLSAPKWIFILLLLYYVRNGWQCPSTMSEFIE